MYSNKYFPPKYFADKYFGTGSDVEGSIAGSVAGVSAAVATVTALGVLRATVSSGATSSASLVAFAQDDGGTIGAGMIRRRKELQAQIDEEDALILMMIKSVLPYYATSSGGNTWAH